METKVHLSYGSCVHYHLRKAVFRNSAVNLETQWAWVLERAYIQAYCESLEEISLWRSSTSRQSPFPRCHILQPIIDSYTALNTSVVNNGMSVSGKRNILKHLHGETVSPF